MGCVVYLEDLERTGIVAKLYDLERHWNQCDAYEKDWAKRVESIQYLSTLNTDGRNIAAMQARKEWIDKFKRDSPGVKHAELPWAEPIRIIDNPVSNLDICKRFNELADKKQREGLTSSEQREYVLVGGQ